jgi:hypothetical protein
MAASDPPSRISSPARSAGGPPPPRPRRSVWAWYSLLVVPFVGTLWVPFYNSVEPRAGGVPFFYWYQFGWIGIGAVLTAIVYFATRDPSGRDAVPKQRP